MTSTPDTFQPWILRRGGRRARGPADLVYSHVTQIMVDALRAALQQRWEQYGTWAWSTHRAHAELIA